jgi:shikimate kinase
LKHVILTGFMGVGKTAIGKRLAKRLGRPFVDTDHMIEGNEGADVAEIFEREGEAGFRAIERAVVAGLATAAPSVIATGGGTFVDDDNRNRLLEMGVVVCLVTKFETIMERVSRNVRRPLAQGDARGRLEALYEERKAAYGKADVLVETDGLSVDQSAVRILNMIQPHLKEDPQIPPGGSVDE